MPPIRKFPRLLCCGLLLLASTAGASIRPEVEFAGERRGPNHTDPANGTTTIIPSIRAHALDGAEITVDGILDDDAWGRAETGWGFRQADPRRGGEATVPTTFKVAYDADAIYLAVACWEEDVANIASYLSRRDDIQASDLVSIYLDPYHDRTTGYNFRINPDGVQQDAYLYDNGSRDESWNAVWESAVHHSPTGWFCELRIPFAAIRFQPDDEEMTWGLQVYRWMHGRGEDTGWVIWDRDQNGFVSRWGKLTGLRGIENPRQLQILPYVVTRHTDPAAEGADDTWQGFQNFGADFKYGVTSNLTLNATFQPDFGQVEADPATLNLSPFETYYSEKRPFFVEGARFFQHPDFRMFYSRRIGTGDPNSRIRAAAKLTGKLGGDFSLAVLGATTDVARPGRVHNPMSEGTRRAHYGLVRVGKEFAEGNHNINLMGTSVLRDEATFAGIDYTGFQGERLLRNGYSGGMDFEMNFDDRMYRVRGSMVGTLVKPFANTLDPTQRREDRYGTGGRLEMRKTSGTWRASLAGRYENDRFDPNDMGYISAPDEKIVAAWGGYFYNADGKESLFNSANVDLEISQSWIYAGGAGFDIDTGEEVWRHGPGIQRSGGIGVSASMQSRGFHQAWIYLGRYRQGFDKHATRGYGTWPDHQRGPLILTPGYTGFAVGGTTDWRRPLSLDAEFHHDIGDEGERYYATSAELTWNQSQHFNHSIGLGWSHSAAADQWLYNIANDGSQPGVTGIGGVDYVFAKLDRHTWDLTLRSNILFDKDRSLQIYLQPFLTYGDYRDASWLASPASYHLRPYGDDASRYDFAYGAVNLNVVYRWEYRPGSTLFLVWTHTKNRYEERATSADPAGWSHDFNATFPFRTEPGNTLLAKFSYWFSI